LLTLMNAMLEKILNQSADHAVAGPFSGCLDGVYVGLSVAPTTAQNPNGVLANIHEATYTGYARQLLVWHPAYIEPAGSVAIQSASLYWTPTDAVVPNIITGLFLADAITVGNLLGAEQFDVGQNLGGPSNAFSSTVLVQLLTTLGYGFSTITN
jgi:hypothetical protein